MRVRDELEYERKRQQIMDAALTVIAEKGFEKATNEEIARAAGIGTSGLIYHYFENKADLLHQIVEAHSPDLQALSKEIAVTGMPPRKALTRVASAFLERLSDPSSIALFRVLLSETLRRPSVAEVWSDSFSGQQWRTLGRYLTAQMDAGTLRRMDVGVAIRCFIGPLFFYMLIHEILPANGTQAPTPEAMAEAAVDIFLQGMMARPEEQGQA